jgi:branched-chain amino acid aminotransferase
MLQEFNPKNQDILVFVNGEIVPRSKARISVFDSVVQGGDAVWEGLRVYQGRIFCLDKHMLRLQESAHALMFEDIPHETFIRSAIFETLKANGMSDGVHIRLTLTRGEKITSGMDPRLNQNGCGLIVLAEWKVPVYDNRGGIEIISSTIRRNEPNFLDSKIHHNNLLNNILAKIQANVAQVDAALMLDSNGFLSELNGTNIFIIKDGTVLTPYATSCLPGITRGIVIECANALGLSCKEGNISLTQLYNADAAFATGTMGELTPIVKVDGRKIKSCWNSEIFLDLSQKFRKRTELEGEPIV